MEHQIGKFWVIQRSVEYQAIWRDGQLVTDDRNSPSYMWTVSECYTTDNQPPTGFDTNIGEIYTWAYTADHKAADTIARAFAAEHGGTVSQMPWVAKAVGDPTKYDPELWS